MGIVLAVYNYVKPILVWANNSREHGGDIIKIRCFNKEVNTKNLKEQ